MARQTFGSHAQTAHVWANQWDTIPYGRSNDGRMFFENGTIYSHGRHFPIAKFHKGKGGATYVLFTTRGYSSSTAKHKSRAYRALGYGRGNVYYVTDVEQPEKAKADYEARIEAALIKAPRCRGENVQRMLSEATELTEEANKLADVAGFRWRLEPLPIGDELLERAREQSALKKEREKRDAAKAARAMLAKDKAVLERWRNDPETGLIAPEALMTLRNARLFTVADKAEVQRRWDQAWQDWRDHKRTYAPERSGDKARLRLSVDRKTIETSAGAEFPVEHGMKAWPLLKRVIASNPEGGTIWERNGHTVHLGHFQIDRVVRRLGTTDDVTIVANCHYVAWTEVAAIARALGLEK
jgi:hypothetical protein